MSNWGSPYSNNKNYNYRNCEPSSDRWQYLSQPVNNAAPIVYSSPQNGTSEFYNTSYMQGSHVFQNSNASTAGSHMDTSTSCNMNSNQFNNDIWLKAANSNLVPTAGEFIPSATYHQSPSQSSSNLVNSQEYCNQGAEGLPVNDDFDNSFNNLNTKDSNVYDRKSDETPASSRFGSNRFKSVSQGYKNINGFNAGNHNAHRSSYHDSKGYKNNSNREYYQRNSKSGSEKYNRNNSRHLGYGHTHNHGSSYVSQNNSSNNSYLGSNCRPNSGPSRIDLKSEDRRKVLQEVASLLNPVDRHLSAGSDSSSSSKGLVNSDGECKKFNNYRGGSDFSNGGSYRESKKNYNFRNNYRETRQKQNSVSQGPLSSINECRTSTSSAASKLSDKDLSFDGKTISQRERLTDQLQRGSLECLVCYERVRQSDPVWNCANCFHILHLRCIIKWANSSKSDNGWRCPACQNVSKSTPSYYYCFCGNVIDPDWNRNDIPHSCGEVCNKPKPDPSPYFKCNHRCTLLCHPGPCPPCVTMIQRNCGCGRTTQMVQCGQNSQTISCGETCCKELNCGEHFCQDVCHLGDCKQCPVKIAQVCYCGASSREVTCDRTSKGISNYECGNQCQKKLDCGQHPCLKNCHPGNCGSCPLAPSKVSHCPCGKNPLDCSIVRETCLDPVPTCDEICAKPLTCGEPGSRHTCKSICHENSCPPCELTTSVKCRCGYMDEDLPCKELVEKENDVRCKKKCSKKRSCGKHKCNQLCCIDIEHICTLPCNHFLSCGQHRCEELCHRGRCKPCWRTSFEELHCECGSSVMFPPIPCGTKPPECKKPCTRQHDCDHPALHYCHSGPSCPPCTVLTSKYCHGMHELRKTVPCHLEDFSCGLPCNKELSCGRHKCILPCHKGECLKPGQSCVQPCAKIRSLCGHACNAPCHEDECPDSLCKEKVKVTCECGNRSTTRPCCENNKEYQRIATSLLASKMADVQLGRSIDLQDMQGARNKMSLKTLECNEECRLIERNRRLCIGLQIRNPDLTAKLTPRYSDFMRGWAKKDPRFCQHIHDKLTELVQLAKESKQKSRSYSFETMNREKRQFVHEYCEHFGCESVAYDAEPKRNVVATAQREKAWLPSYSLLEVIQREMGQRKVPVPTLNGVKKTGAIGKILRAAPPTRLGQDKTLASRSSNPPQVTNNSNKIDYFNYTNG